MKTITTLLILLISLSTNAEVEVSAQEGQKVLIKTNQLFDQFSLLENGKDCIGTIQDKIGDYSIIEIKKKAIVETTDSYNQVKKTECELKNPIMAENIKIQKKEIKKQSSFGFFSLGFSSGKDVPSTPSLKIDTILFNYAFGYYSKSDLWLTGWIFQDLSSRAYGSIETKVGNAIQSNEYNSQSNNYLFGFSFRRIQPQASGPYFGADIGLSWMTLGESVIGLPFEFDTAPDTFGFGANLAIGIQVETKALNRVDFGISESLRSNGDYNSATTNFMIGIYF